VAIITGVLSLMTSLDLLGHYFCLLIKRKIHCLNSLIFIYFRVVYLVLHVFCLVFRCVSSTKGVKSKRMKEGGEKSNLG